MKKKPNNIDHIGIAVKSLNDHLPFYENQLGLELLHIEEVPTQHVKVAFLQIGTSKLELLEPMSKDSPVARYIDKHGEGVHHVALNVSNIDERLKEIRNEGIRTIQKTPVPGAGGARVAFLHPKATGGVLYEFCEK